MLLHCLTFHFSGMWTVDDCRMSNWMFLFHVQLNKIEQTCFSSPELTKTHSKSLLETKAQGLLHCCPQVQNCCTSSVFGRSSVIWQGDSARIPQWCGWTLNDYWWRSLLQFPDVVYQWFVLGRASKFLEMIRLLCHGPWISTEFCHLLWPWPMESSGTWEHQVLRGNIVQCGEFIIFTHLGFSNPLGSATKILFFFNMGKLWYCAGIWGTLFLHKPVCWLLIIW